MSHNKFYFLSDASNAINASNASHPGLETFPMNRSHSPSAPMNQTSSTMSLHILEGLVSDEFVQVYENVMDVGVNSVLACMGVVNNILTIIVFARLGYKDTANISMTALSCSSLVVCFCHAVENLYGPMKLVSATLGLSWRNLSTIVFSSTAAVASYVSGGLASYVAIERCLCISMPFKVKYLFTRKSVTVTCVAICVLVSGSYVINYSRFEFDYAQDPITNKTFLIFLLNAFNDRYPGVQVYTFVLSMLYPVATLGITFICTIIIVYHLKKASSFRAGLGRDNPEEAQESTQLSSRDRQVIRMLVVVLTVYIIGAVPHVIFFFGLSFVPDFFAGMRYNNLFWVCLNLVSTFSLIDASANIFIFYSMSSQFKQTVKQLFHIEDINQKK